MTPATQLVDRRQVLAFRLRRHRLERPVDGEDAAVRALLEVAGACPVQNTPPGAAALALRVRIAGLTPAGLDGGLATRALLQAWSLRATPHVFPAADLAVFTTALFPADDDEARYLLRPILPDLDGMGLPAKAAIERTADAIEGALAGGSLSRDELLDELARRLPEGLNPWCPRCAIRHVHPSLQRAAALGGGFLIASQAGDAVSFVRTDRWLGALPATETAETTAAATGAGPGAGAELVRRYLRCYGPSTAGEFATWAGIAPRAARRLWGLVAPDLLPVVAAGRAAWLLAEDAADLAGDGLDGVRLDGVRLDGGPGEGELPAGVRLLPPNDPYLAQPDRETIVPDREQRARIWRPAAGPGVLIVDGEVAGTWRSRKAGRAGRRLEVTVEPFVRLPASVRREVASNGAVLARFRECESAEVRWTDETGEGPAE